MLCDCVLLIDWWVWDWGWWWCFWGNGEWLFLICGLLEIVYFKGWGEIDCFWFLDDFELLLDEFIMVGGGVEGIGWR